MEEIKIRGVNLVQFGWALISDGFDTALEVGWVFYSRLDFDVSWHFLQTFRPNSARRVFDIPQDLLPSVAG